MINPFVLVDTNAKIWAPDEPVVLVGVVRTTSECMAAIERNEKRGRARLHRILQQMPNQIQLAKLRATHEMYGDYLVHREVAKRLRQEANTPQ